MESKMQVMIGSSDLAVSERFTDILRSKGLALRRFHSIKQACNVFSRKTMYSYFLREST